MREALADFQPWGFKVEGIPFKKVFMWHGEQDRLIPAALARLLAQVLPHKVEKGSKAAALAISVKEEIYATGLGFLYSHRAARV